MTSSTNPNEGFAGFGKFVPGFDFLQNLVTQTAANAAQNSTAAAQPMPGLGSWIAPTLNVEDLDRRIKELKTVQFWLDQNATALKATITALEVQKMTLSTLKDMNFSMTEVANAFKIKVPGAPEAAGASASDKSKSFAGLEIPATIFGHPAVDAQINAAQAQPTAQSTAQPENAAAPADASVSRVDPMQWWGALTQQFQSIAADAMKDVAQKAATAPVGMPADPVPGPVAQGNSLADQAMAAMAASREALAQSPRKTLQDGAALMGKSLKQSARPMPGAAVAVKKAIKKPAAKPAISSTASPRAKPVAPKPASAVLKKAPAKSTAKPSAARKTLR